MTDPRQIADRLTEAQKRYLLREKLHIGNPQRWFLYGAEALSKRTLPTRNVLTRIGLLEHGRFGPTMLTDLGLSVRAILKEDQP